MEIYFLWSIDDKYMKNSFLDFFPKCQNWAHCASEGGKLGGNSVRQDTADMIVFLKVRVGWLQAGGLQG